MNASAFQCILVGFLCPKCHNFDCCSVVLLKSNVANIILFNFCEQKLVQHGPITIVCECSGFSLRIFKEKWPNFVSGPKSAPNSDSFWMRRLFNACVRVFCATNATILIVYMPAKIGIIRKSIAGPLPSVVQEYTQPYSFGRRIKLIICQIRHGNSYTIHEISSEKKRKMANPILRFGQLQRRYSIVSNSSSSQTAQQ